MSPPLLSTTPTAEKPALSEEQRAGQLRLLAECLHSPMGWIAMRSNASSS